MTEVGVAQGVDDCAPAARSGTHRSRCSATTHHVATKEKSSTTDRAALRSRCRASPRRRHHQRAHRATRTSPDVHDARRRVRAPRSRRWWSAPPAPASRRSRPRRAWTRARATRSGVASVPPHRVCGTGRAGAPERDERATRDGRATPCRSACRRRHATARCRRHDSARAPTRTDPAAGSRPTSRTTSTPRPANTMTSRAARNVRARDQIATQNTTLPISTAMPSERQEPRDAPRLADGLRARWSARRRSARPVTSRPVALPPVPIWNVNAPWIGCVSADVTRHVTTYDPSASLPRGLGAHGVAGGLRRRIGGDAIAVLVVEPYAAERDRHRLAELEDDCVRRCR